LNFFFFRIVAYKNSYGILNYSYVEIILHVLLNVIISLEGIGSEPSFGGIW